ncbi:60Kd inner membrane protein-domain-containing protein [Aspergillus falconensis]
MLAGPGLKGRIARQQFAAFAQSSRSMSSFRPKVSRFSARNNKVLGGSTSWRPPVPSIALPAARFNSTSTSAPTEVTPETQTSSEWDVSNIDLTQIPERIGYLKDLGLDYGWGPSAIVEFMIEHIHVYSGLPWVGSIIATGIFFRLAMAPLFWRAGDTSARLANAQPILAPIKEKMLNAARSGNQVEAQKWRAEMAKTNSSLGIVPRNTFMPLLFQLPVGFGCFRVIEGMAGLPVPGLAAEKFAWINDFTVADPTYILPILCCTVLHLSIRKGGEMGSSMSGDMATIRKGMMYGIPAFSFFFVAFFPAALQTYFLTTGVLGLIQAYAFASATFRKATGMTVPEKLNPVQPSGSTPAEPNRALRLITEALERENAKLNEAKKLAAEQPNISFIDRAINNIKESKEKLAKETTQKMQELSGQGPKKNADGSLAEPPRLSEKDRKLAEDYERRRKEEEDWKREERNHARREAHRQAMERERQKAKAALNKSEAKR